MIFGSRQQDAPASLRIIDIGKLVEPFRYVGWANYLLFFLGGWSALTQLMALFQEKPTLLGLLFHLLMLGVASYWAWTAWNNTGVATALKNHNTYFCLVTMTLPGVVLALALCSSSVRNDLDNKDGVGLVTVAALLLGAGLLGLFALLRLRKMVVPALGLKLQDFLANPVLHPEYHPEKLPAQDRSKGIWLLAGGFAYLVGMSFIVDLLPESVSRSASQLFLLGYGLLAMARQCFQPNFETVMERDHRRPILFLRSFADDEKLNYGKADRSLLDFSLESRLAKHFFEFGPFIAIGAPGEPAKGLAASTHLGAVRVQLSDDEWQNAVTGWMDSSLLILCMAGWSQWVVWEMKKIIERGHAQKLLLLLPEIKVMPWKRTKDVQRRVDRIREAFAGSPWETALAGIQKPANLRCLVFGDHGEVTAVVSKPRTRHAYQLAAVVGHALLLKLDQTPAAVTTEQTSPVLSGLPRRAIGAAIDGLLILTLAVLAFRIFPLGSMLDPALQEAGLWLLVPLSAGVVAPAVLYHLAMEAAFGATLGKTIAGVAVTGANGERCSWKSSVRRNLLRPVDGIGLYLLAFVTAELSKMKQTLGDRVGSTIVVRHAHSPLLRWGAALVAIPLLLVGCFQANLVADKLGNASVSPLLALPDTVWTSSQGELHVGNLSFIVKDGSEHSSTYKPGEAANVSFEIARFGRDSNGKADLSFTQGLLDPTRSLVDKPETSEFREAVPATLRIEKKWGDYLPTYAPAGTYHFNIAVHDNVTGAEVRFQPAFTVTGVAQPCTEPAVRNLYLSASEDGPAADSSALRPGDTRYVHLTLCGLALKNGHLNARVGQRITNAGGAVLLDSPNSIDDRKEVFYHPATYAQDFVGKPLNLGKLPRGSYRIHVRALDQWTGKTAVGEVDFQVR